MLAEPADDRDEGRDARCSDHRGTCIVGRALRCNSNPSTAIAEAFEAHLYRGVRPTMRPLTRADACAEILALHCDAHRGAATALLAGLSPVAGLPRHKRTPPRGAPGP